MTAIQRTTAATPAAATGTGGASGLTQQPRVPQQRTAHSLAQRGMHGSQPQGVHQQPQDPQAQPSASAASQQGMHDLERANAAAAELNAMFNSQKTLADTLNAMLTGMADSSSKATAACSEAGKGIRVS
ncbi:hypothetical protein ACX0MV_17105 [Pseudomonas borbori]